MHHSQNRATLGGKLSAVLVAAGSSVGLGNIWRFPYVAGDNGGGAFLVIYILCVLLLGLPVMVAEFTIGRASKRNAVGAYRALNPRWSFLGYNGVLAAFLILGFYFVVSGWTAEYMVHSVTGSLAKFSTPEEYSSIFENFISSPWRPVLYTALFVLATHFVIALGVQKGIERSAKVLMPLLFAILIALSIHSLLMPGGEEGLRVAPLPQTSGDKHVTEARANAPLQRLVALLILQNAGCGRRSVFVRLGKPRKACYNFGFPPSEKNVTHVRNSLHAHRSRNGKLPRDRARRRALPCRCGLRRRRALPRLP